jgi:hypothetical protein
MVDFGGLEQFGFVFGFFRQFHYVAQAGLELIIFLLQASSMGIIAMNQCTSLYPSSSAIFCILKVLNLSLPQFFCL